MKNRPPEKWIKTMSISVREVFDAAMYLMNRLGSTGQTDTRNNESYKARTPALVRLLMQECLAIDDGAAAAVDEISQLDDALPLDENLCRAAVPYGLAGLLLLEENPGSAAYMIEKYNELRVRYQTQKPSLSEPVFDVYGQSAGK